MKRKFVQLICSPDEYTEWTALDSEGHVWEWNPETSRWATASPEFNRMPWGSEPQESVKLGGWKEGSTYGLALSTGKEQLMHAMADAIVKEICDSTEPVGDETHARAVLFDAIIKYARRYNAHVGDSDQKLAQCFEELAQLRRRAHTERLDGMKCIYTIFTHYFKELDSEKLRMCKDAMESIMYLNRARSEDVDDKTTEAT